MFVAWVVVALGMEGEGASAEANMGSDDPVKSDAAVAAAATLVYNKINNTSKGYDTYPHT